MEKRAERKAAKVQALVPPRPAPLRSAAGGGRACGRRRRAPLLELRGARARVGAAGGRVGV